MINVQNSNLAIDQTGILPLPNGKLFVYWKEDKSVAAPNRCGMVITNQDGSIAFGPAYVNFNYGT